LQDNLVTKEQDLKLYPHSIVFLVILTTLMSCSKKKTEALSDFPQNTEFAEVDNDEVTPAPIYKQDFQSFEFSGSWILSDFGLQVGSPKQDYIQDGEIKFDIRWTKRTRNHLADLLGYQRSEMTDELANSLCEPKIEIGQASAYNAGSSENLITELDTDLQHCQISGTEPAAITIRSFIPTKPGYNYRVSFNYQMRSYQGMTTNSYRDLVVRFGRGLEKFDPVFNGFSNQSLEITAINKYSALVFTDNGLPNSYGVLLDNILVQELGKAENYDSCSEIFSVNSRGFKKCLEGDVETNQVCDFSDPTQVHINYSPGAGVAANRKNTANIFNQAGEVNSSINFLSLGKKGRVALACTVDGHKGLMDVYGKTLSLKEISWGNITLASYPELALVRVKLESCTDSTVNGLKTVATVGTKQNLSYTFEIDDQNRSYEGCKMSSLIIKDITPNGPSGDGFDFNSLKFE
jgi:hypothetical protein